ncbi:MAG: sulfur oxidation protein SoxY [Xanthobacteraceae bacterium]|nr:sulfur oxidation protein SoxY [Xanthobacteraceae bacterium]
MVEKTSATGVTRRTVLGTIVGGGAGLATGRLSTQGLAAPAAIDEAVALVQELTGKTPTVSDRVRLSMPAHFANGYTVPLTLTVASPMTDADHVRRVIVLAPRNPIVTVASFHFVPLRSEPRIATRIRLAEAQDVLALAEMNDGALLMARMHVDVATNGCE